MSEKIDKSKATSMVFVGKDGEFIEVPIVQEPREEMKVPDAEYFDEAPYDADASYDEEGTNEPAADADMKPKATFPRMMRNKEKTLINEQFTRKDKILRSIGAATVYVTVATGIPVASAYVANQVVSKVQYGVDIDAWQQLDNFAQLPSKITDGIESTRKIMDVARYFGMNEVGGDGND